MSIVVFSAIQVVWVDLNKPDTFLPLCDKLTTSEDGMILKRPQDAEESVLLKNCLLVSKPIYENRVWIGMNNVTSINNNIILKNVNTLLMSQRSNIHAIRAIIRLDYCVRSGENGSKNNFNHDSLILSSWM